MTSTLYVATRKGLFTVQRDGSSTRPDWRVRDAAFPGDHCSAVLWDGRGGHLYAALGHGHFGVKLHLSEDGERGWRELPAPAYPEKPADEAEWTDPYGRAIPHSLELIWSLEAGHPSQPNLLWCGTMPGGLFRSDDLGESWTLVRSLWDHPSRKRWMGGGADYPGIHSLSPHPDDPGQLTLAVSCGGVWETKDSAVTWTCIGEGWRAEYLPPEQASDPVTQDPHRLIRCRGQPDHLWVQHHNGIFRSTDAGRTWREIEGVQPSAFGFAVAVHPEDPLTAWFVPALKDERRIPVDGRVVVTRTRDGGESFEILRDGLPQEHAYDLVYRHGMAIDDTGNILAIGSTTGSLWISEDQGEHWACVSSHLPPIYQVRFKD